MLSIHNLTAGYNRHPIIHHINATFEKGDLVAIVGPNGGGKSTLLRVIDKQIEPMEGSIINKFSSKACIPQKHNIDYNFPIKLKTFISFGLIKKTGLFKPLSSSDKSHINEALQLVGLEKFADAYLSNLSGGQLQRALFARMSLQNADLLLLDEPFNAIDQKTITELSHILQQWNKEGKTIIAVIHDISMVKNIFPKTFLLAREIVGFGDTEKILTEKNLFNAFNSSNILINPDAEICHR